MSRKVSRELTMKLLFQYEFQKEDRENQLDEILKTEDLSENDKEYIIGVIRGVDQQLGHIDEIIGQYTKGWKIARMSKVDVAILRIAIYELFFMEDIPCSVTINEAVEIAKKFSSEESGSFINGILGKISKISSFPNTNVAEGHSEPTKIQDHE